jgi:GntR family transcriptional regulator
VAQVYRYRAVAAKLRAEITSGHLKPGDKLPPEPKLVEQFGCSRDTVRDATKLLIQEGLVERVPGRAGGMVVRERLMLIFHASYAEKPGAPRSEADSWATDVRAQGLDPSQDFECRMVTLPGDIALRLAEPEGAPAVLRRCVRQVNGRPSSIQDSYYPMWLANEVPDLLSPTDIPEGTTTLLAQRGHVQVGYLDHNTARMPAPDEVNLLQIGPGTPVLVKIRTACTAGRVVRVTVEVMAGDSNTVEYEIGDIAVLGAEAASQ